ncbi:ABC transporter ATP-binding protein [Streptococcus dentasini]
MNIWKSLILALWLISLAVIFIGNVILSDFGLLWETRIMHIGLILFLSGPSLLLLLLGKLSWWKSFFLAAVLSLIIFTITTTAGIAPFNNYRDQGRYLVTEEGSLFDTGIHCDYHLKRPYCTMEEKVVKTVYLE